ncbi:MAG TPA: hypothetical protein VD833_22400 [Vicinamibacterales bacterium]|nr:hypothetical protein [Vicinamibacterales bacterium]
MSWFRVSGERFRYRGRITREPFLAWTRSDDGAAAVTSVASTLRIPICTQARARRRMWLSLDRAARSHSLRAVLQTEADRFMDTMASLSYAASLPRAHVALRRLVVVPRTMILGRARPALYDRLRLANGLSGVDDLVRLFFYERLLTEMNRGFERATPTPQSPVRTHTEWACVGLDTKYVWVDPLWSGEDWMGHVFMYEFPPRGLSRRDRRELEEALEKLRGHLEGISRIQREGVVRSAVESFRMAG